MTNSRGSALRWSREGRTGASGAVRGTAPQVQVMQQKIVIIGAGPFIP
jgi:hypothetical protein